MQDNWPMVSFDSSSTPGEEEERESKEDQQKVSYFKPSYKVDHYFLHTGMH